jgi:hypothetical protein
MDKSLRANDQRRDSHHGARVRPTLGDALCDASPKMAPLRHSDDLRQALGREIWEEDVLDTIGDQEPPTAVTRCGDARIGLGKSASIRRELERLTTARGR